MNDGTFVAPEGRIPWVMGRALLDQGLTVLGSLGDVQIWPVRPEGARTACLQPNHRDGTALFELPLPPLSGGWRPPTGGCPPVPSCGTWTGTPGPPLCTRRPRSAVPAR
ncbi:SsgA family sporulation/cell division regulator [Kitasatospora herbaricolor]|uniref:SsgA family sporulation/cell division regulator n=1 Tax=Kitasatospora herbaricolor TaxID=68217 RepID=A0ABZ1WIK7_9ACTN|nr:SsgA family sporulation/cell division regulator [Kitasatospora herbaricolor]